jgi:hypothetical protein
MKESKNSGKSPYQCNNLRGFISNGRINKKTYSIDDSRNNNNFKKESGWTRDSMKDNFNGREDTTKSTNKTTYLKKNENYVNISLISRTNKLKKDDSIIATMNMKKGICAMIPDNIESVEEMHFIFVLFHQKAKKSLIKMENEIKGAKSKENTEMIRPALDDNDF